MDQKVSRLKTVINSSKKKVIKSENKSSPKSFETKKQQPTIPYHTLSPEETFSKLNSSEKGLTAHHAEERLHKYGFNEIKLDKGVHPLEILLGQFSSPLVWILLGALGISFFLKEYLDTIVILIIIIANAILGFMQEYKAEKAIEALKRMTSPRARVLRDGREIKIESKFVVPGDIVLLQAGDKVPAGGRLIEIHNLQTMEASLTGESQPVTKILGVVSKNFVIADRKNMVYASTVVTKGRAKAIVTATGMKTEVGKIAKLIKEAHRKSTPLQKKLRVLGKRLTIAVLLVAIVVFLAGLLSGESASVMFITAIALAVAAIPEGLPAVITISLAIGVRRMVKKNALVRRLPSVETLGSVDVICTDKTGTLTHNQMTVTNIWANNLVYAVSGSGYESKGRFFAGKKQITPTSLNLLLKIGSLCNDAKLHFVKKQIEVNGDPTEAAVLISAQKAGIFREKLEEKEPRIDEIPFTSERKMMTTIHKTKERTVSFSKGAPDVIINLCDCILINGRVQRLSRATKKNILEQNKKFASKALRVLAFSYNDNFQKKENAERRMIFVGLQAMIDPPRKEVKASIAKCQKAGIRVIMITGDQLPTAQAIADYLGIKGRAVVGQDLGKIKNLKKEIKDIGIFARVNPEHKLAIVKALKDTNHVVAMTGDGINDAPALKKADIGVSMGISGTDVAKEASDMILTDDNFTSIVNAVEEGRGIFDNIRKFVNYLLSNNLGEVTVILFASLFGLPLPLTAIQILWINLVTDGLPATALALDPHSKGLMERPPRPAQESILSKELRIDIIVFGILLGLISLALFWLYQGSGIVKAQTMVFTALVTFEIVRLYVIRAEYKLPFFSNKWLIIAVLISLLLHIPAIYIPFFHGIFNTTSLAIIDWIFLALASVVLFVLYKIIRRVIRNFEHRTLKKEIKFKKVQSLKTLKKVVPKAS